MMPEISIKAKLSQRYANHSVRATSISAMDNAGVEARHIMSGNRSESSIRSYSKRLSENKQREISDSLNSALQTEPTKDLNTPLYLNSVQQKLKLYYLIQKLFLKKFRQILALQHAQIRMTFALLVFKIRRTYMYLHLHLKMFICQ